MNSECKRKTSLINQLYIELGLKKVSSWKIKMHKVKLKFASPLSFSESNWSKYFGLYWLLWPWKVFLNLVRVWCQVSIQRVLKEQRSSAHWTYFIKILSNYNTQSLYHFKNTFIVALKTDIVTFHTVKSLKVISGFNLIKVKNPQLNKIRKTFRKQAFLTVFHSLFNFGTLLAL